MAGIYIHIPFCKNKCYYCNFFSVASLKHRSGFIQSLCTEIELQKEFLLPDIPRTIYIGGGTPSILSLNELEDIFKTLDTHFDLSKVEEITLEANPEDLSLETLRAYQKYLPINRLSIGIQSLFEEDLQYLNRKQNPHLIETTIENAYLCGFHNLSVDFIYGIPTLSNEHLQENLEFAVRMKIPHISCYSLSIEDKTPLALQIAKGLVNPPAEEQSIEQFQLVHHFLESHGYKHYEISNYALDGKESQHNSNYWNATKYLGLGAGAHSYDGKYSRHWNVSNLTEYIQQLQEHKLPCEYEHLTDIDLFNEYVMLALRTSKGIDLGYMQSRFSEYVCKDVLQKSAEFIAENLLILSQNRLYPTLQGMLVADYIAASLFL